MTLTKLSSILLQTQKRVNSQIPKVATIALFFAIIHLVLSMPEEAEGQNLSQVNKKFTEIEAPERLQVGQNLYDQEPFSSIAKRICESTGTPLDRVRSHISYYAKIAEAHYVIKDHVFRAIEPITEMGYRPLNVRLHHYTFKMLETVQETLQMYPYWSEYIAQQREDRLYAYNGNFVKENYLKTELPAISYANWVTQKLQRENRLSLLRIKEVLDEVFPQDVSRPVTSQPNVTGLNPANRRYRILKATEIIK